MSEGGYLNGDNISFTIEQNTYLSLHLCIILLYHEFASNPFSSPETEESSALDFYFSVNLLNFEVHQLLFLGVDVVFFLLFVCFYLIELCITGE